MIPLKSQGRTSADIGQIVGVRQNPVNQWLNRYEAEGIKGPRTKLGQGRKSILRPEDTEAVKKAVSKE